VLAKSIFATVFASYHLYTMTAQIRDLHITVTTGRFLTSPFHFVITCM